jgi:hypothetical protein
MILTDLKHAKSIEACHPLFKANSYTLKAM